MQRLNLRVNNLEQSGISYNRLANYLHISFRTLSDISKLTYRHRQRPRHCPWDMLRRLEHAETEIPRFNHSHILSRGAPRGKKAAHEQQHLNSRPDPENFILPKGACIKCHASWPNLYYDGEDPHRNFVYTCHLCGKSNLVSSDPPTTKNRPSYHTSGPANSGPERP